MRLDKSGFLTDFAAGNTSCKSVSGGGGVQHEAGERDDFSSPVVCRSYGQKEDMAEIDMHLWACAATDCIEASDNSETCPRLERPRRQHLCRAYGLLRLRRNLGGRLLPTRLRLPKWKQLPGQSGKPGLCWAPAGATIGVVTVDTITVTGESQTVPLTIHLTTTVDSVITAQTQVSALQATTSPGTATVTQVVQVTGSSGGGLTSAQIGGISGGAAALLLLVAGGVYILIRRLNVIAKFMREHSKEGQGGGPDLPNDGKGEMEAKSIFAPLPGQSKRNWNRGRGTVASAWKPCFLDATTTAA
ncbi:hypothetical protein CSOJ01_04012 [Colletotrichum sojae]|uniref:Uncharacterized protein n=1 Tax=Colletotrichum sojae TaxID=2175907 RepID=A0A8H6JKP2_9PEZI|nr:hypothetical protein CSOJ01_04012 [Colletotrichum sojae]